MTRPASIAEAYAAAGGVTGVFSDKVVAYVRSRPDYPPALFDALIAQAGLAPGAVVADLGAGTGLLTCGWLGRGMQCIAVEPNADMRAAADRWLGRVPGYRSCAAPAEATGLADGSVDLVTAAQAFHWFDPPRAAAECRRILRAGQPVALVWNDRDGSAPVNVALTALFARHGGSRRDALLAGERDDTQLARFFGGAAPTPMHFTHTHRLDLEGLVALALSRSYMPKAGTEQALQVRREVETVFIELQQDGCVVVPYDTVCYLGQPAG